MGGPPSDPASPDTTEATLRRLKAKYPPKPPEPPPVARQPFFTRRVVAGLIDLFLIGGILTALFDWVLVPLAIDRFAPAPPQGIPPAFTAPFVEYRFSQYAAVAQMLTFLALMAVTEVVFHRSPGKWLTGLEMIERDGRSLNLPRRALPRRPVAAVLRHACDQRRAGRRDGRLDRSAAGVALGIDRSHGSHCAGDPGRLARRLRQ